MDDDNDDMTMNGMQQIGQTAAAFNTSVSSTAEEYCDDFECLEMLGDAAAQAWEVSNATDAANTFMEDDTQKGLAQLYLEDAEKAFNIDTDNLQEILKVDSVT